MKEDPDVTATTTPAAARTNDGQGQRQCRVQAEATQRVHSTVWFAIIGHMRRLIPMEVPFAKYNSTRRPQCCAPKLCARLSCVGTGSATSAGAPRERGGRLFIFGLPKFRFPYIVTAPYCHFRLVAWLIGVILRIGR